MDESVKNKIIIGLSVLTVIFFISSISSCSNAYRQKAARDKEMANRLDLEERMGKFSQDKNALDEKIKALEKELEEEKATQQVTKKALVQEQLVNQSLKNELEEVTKRKEALENSLKKNNKR